MMRSLLCVSLLLVGVCLTHALQSDASRRAGAASILAAHADVDVQSVLSAANALKIQPKASGKAAAPKEAPFMAFLFVPSKEEKASCGGSIIDEEWIVTARHCIPRGKELSDFQMEYKAMAGTVDRTAFKNPSHEVQIRTIDALVVMEGWTTDFQSKDDIMLVHVTPKFDFSTAFVKPIAIRKQPLPKDAHLRAYGWGSQETGDGSTYAQPTHLQTAEIGPMLTGEACKAFATEQKHQNDMTWDKVYCLAPNPPVATSQGDSGGPLVYKKSPTDAPKLVALVSGAVRVNVDTNVGKYAKWITDAKKSFKDKTPLTGTKVLKITWNPPPPADFANAADVAKWGGMDGCDCNIPAKPGKTIPMDPDCKYQRSQVKVGYSTLSGCPMANDKFYYCNDAGQCATLTPAEWSCAPGGYGDGGLCDKRCGTKKDPDCEFVHMGLPTRDAKCPGDLVISGPDDCTPAVCCRANAGSAKHCTWKAVGTQCSAVPAHKYKTLMVTRKANFKPHDPHHESDESEYDQKCCDSSKALDASHTCKDTCA